MISGAWEKACQGSAVVRDSDALFYFTSTRKVYLLTFDEKFFLRGFVYFRHRLPLTLNVILYPLMPNLARSPFIFLTLLAICLLHLFVMRPTRIMNEFGRSVWMN